MSLVDRSTSITSSGVSDGSSESRRAADAAVTGDAMLVPLMKLYEPDDAGTVERIISPGAKMSTGPP